MQTNGKQGKDGKIARPNEPWTRSQYQRRPKVARYWCIPCLQTHPPSSSLHTTNRWSKASQTAQSSVFGWTFRLGVGWVGWGGRRPNGIRDAGRPKSNVTKGIEEVSKKYKRSLLKKIYNKPCLPLSKKHWLPVETDEDGEVNAEPIDWDARWTYNSKPLQPVQSRVHRLKGNQVLRTRYRRSLSSNVTR